MVAEYILDELGFSMTDSDDPKVLDAVGCVLFRLSELNRETVEKL